MRPSSLLLTLSVAVCLCGTASGQEREIWACQGVESGGLVWRNGIWEVARFKTEPLLLTIDGATSKWKRGSDPERDATCTDMPVGFVVSCVDSVLGADLVVLNREQGLAAHSPVFGAVLPPTPDASGERDAIYVAAFNCSKF